MQNAIESDSEEEKNAALRLGITHILTLSDCMDTLYDAVLTVTAGVSGALIKGIISDQTGDCSEDKNDDR